MSDPRPIVWVHGDALRPTNPALLAAPDAPALFVWDDALLDAWALSLKRIRFIYECLLALPVSIRRGDVAAELLRFAAAAGAQQVLTAPSPSPRFQEIVLLLQEAGLDVIVLPDPPFARLDQPPDLRRFSRYWRQARPHALRPTPDV
jgi:hypothetical protein